MKKITLLFILLLTSYSYSQVVFSEDFNAGLTIPTGWTNNEISTPPTGNVWVIETGGNAPYVSATALYTTGGFSGNYPILDSDAYGGGPEEVALESPSFDCSSLTNVTLSFNNFFVSGYGGEGYVEVYDGTQWIEVVSFSELNVAADTFTAAPVSVDVSTEIAGIANAQVRFRWVGDFSYYWAFDDVSVFQCTVSAPEVATVDSPADAATDVEITYGDPNSVGPFEWTDAVTGDPADSYNFNIGVTPTGDDIGTISGFDSGGTILYDFQPNTVYYWSVDAVNCAGVTPGTVWSFTTSSCTELTAPTAVSAPTPSDGAVGVPIGGPDGSLDFLWTAGDPGDTFVLNFGTSNPPTQSFSDFANGDPLIGLEENTTYYWSIDAYNCAGSTAGTVWSFTTGTLSAESFEKELFKVYPNPTSNILNIESSVTIDNINVLNILGQTVNSYSSNEIINNSIDISNLKNGIYIFKISAEDSTQTIRVVKE